MICELIAWKLYIFDAMVSSVKGLVASGTHGMLYKQCICGKKNILLLYCDY
jgi:hypothetical protein